MKIILKETGGRGRILICRGDFSLADSTDGFRSVGRMRYLRQNMTKRRKRKGGG